MSARQRPRDGGGLNVIALVTVSAAAGFVILLVILLLQMSGVFDSGGTGPRLAVDREKIDLGRVVYDKTVRAVFTVTNIGDKPLQIADRQISVKLVEGCWPPNAVVGSTTLQPGQTTTITAEFMMHEGMGGAHMFDVPVRTNDPTQPEKHLYIASYWIPPGTN